MDQSTSVQTLRCGFNPRTHVKIKQESEAYIIVSSPYGETGGRDSTISHKLVGLPA